MSRFFSEADASAKVDTGVKPGALIPGAAVLHMMPAAYWPTGFAVLAALAGCVPPPSNVVDACTGACPFDSGLVDSGTNDADPSAPDAAVVPVPRVVFASNRTGEYDLYVADLSGTAPIAIAAMPGIDLHPAPSADGTQVAFSSTRSGPLKVHVLDLASDTVRQASLLPERSASPSFSPDGQWIVFEGRVSAEARPDIYRVPSAGGAAQQLTTNGAADSGPVYSSDGGSIFFVSSRGGTFDVWRMDADGSSPGPVLGAEGILGRPAVDPDGSRIVVTRVSDQIAQVDAIDLSTGESVTLTANDDSEPSFAPGALLVTSNRFGNPEVLHLSLPGLSVIRLSSDSHIDGQAAFLPAALSVPADTILSP